MKPKRIVTIAEKIEQLFFFGQHLVRLTPSRNILRTKSRLNQTTYRTRRAEGIRADYMLQHVPLQRSAHVYGAVLSVLMTQLWPDISPVLEPNLLR